MRRALDVVFALTGLLVLSPLFLFIAAAIKVEDRGRVFYSHPRVGRHFRRFGILKFRSMVAGADRMGPPLTSASDTRVTRLGRFLRKYKLDELPQLINVLRGDMRFVGARAEVEQNVQLFPDQYSVLLRDRPGITDPATLRFHNEEAMLTGPDVERMYISEILPRKLQLSLDYAVRRTFVSDLCVVAQTFYVLFRSCTRVHFLRIHRPSRAQ